MFVFFFFHCTGMFKYVSWEMGTVDLDEEEEDLEAEALEAEEEAAEEEGGEEEVRKNML